MRAAATKTLQTEPAPEPKAPELPAIYDRAFPTWINETFASLRLTPPEAIDRCRTQSGKVKARGPWDRDKKIFEPMGSDDFQFMPHQELVRAFLSQEDPTHPLRFRGLYMVHGLGSGKSCSAIAAAEALHHRRNVVVMTPASLKDNFFSEILKCGDPKYRKLPGDAKSIAKEMASKFYHVSYDAPNTLAQLERIPGKLDHKLLIIDEAHNLMNMMCTGSKKGLGLYHEIMEANNLRLLFMSGTPIINDPFEIAIATNLLRGYMNKGMGPIVNPRTYNNARYEMFPNVRDFDMHYLDDRDPDAYRLKNPLPLRMRLAGIFSYYAGVQPQDMLMPKLHAHDTLYIPMSEHQCRLYEEARRPERELEKAAAKKASVQGKSKARGFELAQRTSSGAKLGGTMSLYRAFSRQICNFAFPEAIPRPITNGKSLDIRKDKDKTAPPLELDVVADMDVLTAPEDTVRIDKQDEMRQKQALLALERGADIYLRRDLHLYSPKMKRMVELLEQSPGPAYVYSQFRTMEGIGIFARVLQAHGYIQYGWGHVKSKDVMSPKPHTRDAKTGKRWDQCTAAEKRTFQPLAYLIWPRSAKAAERTQLLHAFNDHANRDGSHIRVFLSTKAGAEGISLMNVRQVHLMEPYWNEALMRQAIGRARRICSHAALPIEDRDVHVYRYVSVFPEKYKSKDKDMKGRPQTSDQYVENIASLKRSITADMMQVLREAAVDCSLNLAHNRLGEGGDQIRCLTYADTEGPAYRLGLDYDAVAMAGLAETQFRTEQLVPLTLPRGKFRVQAADAVRLKHPKADDHGRIDLYHQVDPKVVLGLRLRAGVPVAYEP